MVDVISSVSPPKSIEVEHLGFGNIVKIKWREVPEANYYLVQRKINNEFRTVGLTIANEFIDYEISGFSYEESIYFKYRIASLEHYTETAVEFSNEFTAFLEAVPYDLINNYVSYEEINSKAISVTFNKEMKFVVQDENSTDLDFYKYSAANVDSENLLEKFFSFNVPSAPSSVEQIVSNLKDDSDVFLKYKNGTIVSFNPNTFAKTLTITDFFNKNIKKIDVDFDEKILGVLDATKSNLTILKIFSNLTITMGAPINLGFGIDNSILDFKLINSKIYILDIYGRLHCYLVNTTEETITLDYTLFDKKDILDEYDIFYKRASFLKNIIDNLIVEWSENSFVGGFNLLEQRTLKTFFLSKSEVYTTTNGETTSSVDYIKPLFIAFGKYMNESANSGSTSLTELKDYCFTLIDTFFDLFKGTSITFNKPTNDKINQFIEHLKASVQLDFFLNRCFNSYPKFVEYETRYLEETKLVHSKLNNHLVIIGPYYYKILDLSVIKMSNYFHTIFSAGSLKNNSATDLVSDFDSNILLTDTPELIIQKQTAKAFKTDFVDRFINKYDINDELDSIGVEFEDLRFEPLWNATESKVFLDYCFVDKYADFYRININAIYQDLDANLNYTFFGGFGCPSVFNYSKDTALIKDNYYFYNGFGYHCLKTRLVSARTVFDLDTLLAYELDNGFLIKITNDFFNSLNLTTRVWYTTKNLTFDSSRVFSLYSTATTTDVGFELSSNSPYNFLNGKTLFDYKHYNFFKNIDILFKIDKFKNNILFISVGLEPVGGSNKTIASLSTYYNYYLDSHLILNEELRLKRANYSGGSFYGKIYNTDDPGTFLVPYDDHTGNYYACFFEFSPSSFSSDFFRRIKLNTKNSYFETLYSYWTKMVTTPTAKSYKEFYIYNDAKTTTEKSYTIYGNLTDVVWRWERNQLLITKEDYTAFRVSLDKDNWVYLNKNITSYSFDSSLTDGTHKFYLQYQKLNGNWSSSIVSTYYLKTLKPSTPSLIEIKNADGDNSKPVFYWSSEPDVSYFKLTYNKKNEYTVDTNYHSPTELFSTYESIINVPVEIIAYDKYGNNSDTGLWYFTSSPKYEDYISINYKKTTNSKSPVITWAPIIGGVGVKSIYYSFDESEFENTDKLFFSPKENLIDGVHSFQIKVVDLLDNIIEPVTYYFEIDSQSVKAPVLTEETVERTKNCPVNKAYFYFKYGSSENRMFYSFNEFKSEYEFYDYYLDLTTQNLKTGNNTIYFRFLDKYGNYSDALIYTFYLRTVDSLDPVFEDLDSLTGLLKPTWKWINTNNTQFNSICLRKGSDVIFKNTMWFDNFFTPTFDLGDGCFTLEVLSYDEDKNFSNKIEFDITVDTNYSAVPTLKSFFNDNQKYCFYFNKIENTDIFVRLVEFDNMAEFNNELYFKLDDTNSFHANLKPASNYILFAKSLSSNSIWSTLFKYSFTTNKTLETIEKFDLENNNGTFTVTYNNLDGSFTITPIVTNSIGGFINTDLVFDKLSLNSKLNNVTKKIQIYNKEVGVEFE